MRNGRSAHYTGARLEHAAECLEAARQLAETGGYKRAANRSYYAVSHAMRAVLAFDGTDSKRHSGIISEFRRLYVKTGIFEPGISDIISALFDLRTESDYDDFFVISKEEVLQQVKNAEYFIKAVSEFVANQK